jgi:AcrR family transcriptional regulator
MSRPAGTKNQDHSEKRLALLVSMTKYIECSNNDFPSLRQLSISAGVSDVTLRHYFNDRQGTVIALLKHIRETTVPVRDAMRQPAASVEDAVNAYIALAGTMGENETFMRWHVFALREAIVDPVVHAAYREHILEPSSEAFGECLSRSSGGHMGFPAARQAAAHIIFNAMFLAMQRLLSPPSPSRASMQQSLGEFSNWMLFGILEDPHGTGPSS